MRSVGLIIYYIVQVAIYIVIARFIVDWVRLFARQWRPRGLMAVVLEMLYSVTDPPMRAIRKVIPPIRLGQILLDLSPMILLIILYILSAIIGRLI